MAWNRTVLPSPRAEYRLYPAASDSRRGKEAAPVVGVWLGMVVLSGVGLGQWVVSGGMGWLDWVRSSGATAALTRRPTQSAALPMASAARTARPPATATGGGSAIPGRGSISLAIPKLRQGSYFPDWLLERRRWAAAALVTVVATSYLLGVSTRRMEKLVETPGITGLSKVAGQRDGPGSGHAGGGVPHAAAERRLYTRVAAQTVFMLDGQVVEAGSTDVIFNRPSDRRTQDYVHGRFG
jgi:hypothetical protein